MFDEYVHPYEMDFYHDGRKRMRMKPKDSEFEPPPLNSWTTSKDCHINDDPHYTDVRFHNPDPNSLGYVERTIFGRPRKNRRELTYNYSDRLQQWNYDAHKRAWEAALKKAERKTAAFYEVYLSEYHEKNIILEHIIGGINQASAYSYLVFGFTEKEEKSEES